MKHKVSELEGALLDAAVAMAEGCSTVEFEDGGGRTEFEPSTNWAQGGPIIERERIDVAYWGRKTAEPWRARAEKLRLTRMCGAQTPRLREPLP